MAPIHGIQFIDDPRFLFVIYWIVGIAVVVIFAGSASLLGSWHTRRDIATGRPSYLSLSDRTGIWDRKELARLYGEPDEEDRYTVSAAARFHKSLWQMVFDSMRLNLVSIVGAAVSLWMASTAMPGAAWVLAVCGGYQMMSWSVTVWVVVRNASWAE